MERNGIQTKKKNESKDHFAGGEIMSEYCKGECWLTLIVATVLLGLYLIPTIFFILPPNYIKSYDLLEIIRTVTGGNNTCSPGHPLQMNSICYNELSSFRSHCSPSTSDELLVSVNNVLELQQHTAIILDNSLQFISQPSFECILLLRHLNCMIGFGICEGSGILHLSRESCEAIRNNLCVEDWMEASQFSETNTFLNCNELPSASNACEVDYVWNISSICQKSKCEFETPVPDEPFNCSNNFYFDNNTGLCLPECGWVPSGAKKYIITAHFFAAFAILFPLLYFLLACTLQRQWLQYPSIYYIFLNVDIFLFGIVTIVHLNTSLFCNVQDNFQNLLLESPPLCYFTGTLQVYCLIQFSYWLLSYAVIVYWSLKFPFSYEQAKNSGRVKYICILTILISVIFPLLALILVVDGFYHTNIISSACSARNPLHFYLASTLHLSVTMYTCSLLLFLGTQALYKEHFKLKKISKTKYLKVYQVAEFKLMIVAIVFIAVTVCSLAVNVYLTTTTPEHHSSFNLNTIACHSRGVELAVDCEHFEDNTSVLPIYVFSNISLALQSCISLVTLLINTNYSKYLSYIKSIKSSFLAS